MSLEGENPSHWVVPPPHRLTEVVAAGGLHASGACCTIIAPETPWEEWWSEFGLRRGRGPDVVALRRLELLTACAAARRSRAWRFAIVM